MAVPWVGGVMPRRLSPDRHDHTTRRSRTTAPMTRQLVRATVTGQLDEIRASLGDQFDLCPVGDARRAFENVALDRNTSSSSRRTSSSTEGIAASG
jgi:hypothetical protein